MSGPDELRVRALELAIQSWAGNNVINTAPDAESITSRAEAFYTFLFGQRGPSS